MDHKLNIAQRNTELKEKLYWSEFSRRAYSGLALAGWFALVASLLIGGDCGSL